MSVTHLSIEIYQELRQNYMGKRTGLSKCDKEELQEKYNNVITALREFENILNM